MKIDEVMNVAITEIARAKQFTRAGQLAQRAKEQAMAAAEAKPDPLTVHLGFNITFKMHQALIDIARRESTTVSQLARRVLSAYVERRTP